MIEIVHYFSIEGIAVELLSNEWSNSLSPRDYGRFGVHLSSDLIPRFLEIRKSVDLLVETTSSEIIEIRNSDISLYFNLSGTGALSISGDGVSSLSAAVNEISVLCHERETYLIQGLPLLDWIRSLHPILEPSHTSSDVLQVAIVDDSVGMDDARPNVVKDKAASLVMRDRTLSKQYPNGAVKMPLLLNARDGELVAHGRGVVVLSGHLSATNKMLELVAIQGILVSTQLRAMREELKSLLDVFKDPPSLGMAKEGQILTLKERNHRLRILQVGLTVEVAPIINGLEAPDMVADEFRESFYSSLNLKELYSDGQRLVDTLTSTSETVLRELDFTNARMVQARDASWQFVVGVASGIVVPIALLLSYFGVSAKEVDPEKSIFHPDYYLVWLATSASMVIILGASSLYYFIRNRNG